MRRTELQSLLFGVALLLVTAIALICAAFVRPARGRPGPRRGRRGTGASLPARRLVAPLPAGAVARTIEPAATLSDTSAPA